MADMVTGLYAANAAQEAPHQVRAGGSGQVIDISLFESLFAIMGPDPLLHRLGALPRRGEGTRASSLKGVFLCKDGKWIAMSAATDALVERFLTAVGMRELLGDPRFATYSARLDHRDALNEIVAVWFAERSRAEALAVVEQHGLTAAPLYDVGDALADSHFQARETIVELTDREDATEGVPMHNIVPRFSNVDSGFRYPAPRLGEHTAAILRELDYTEQEVAVLLEQEVVEGLIS